MPVTDTQLITLALVFIAALGSIMFNNSRISDLRDTLSGRFSDMNKSMDNRFSDMNRNMDNRFGDVNKHIDDKFTMLSLQMKTMEENIMRILGDHETDPKAGTPRCWNSN